jgi:hypothetical protein
MLEALWSKWDANNSLSAAELRLAIGCFSLEEGRLPDSLEDLVPRYLESIPLDEFTGEPFGYSREEETLYEEHQNSDPDWPTPGRSWSLRRWRGAR